MDTFCIIVFKLLRLFSQEIIDLLGGGGAECTTSWQWKIRPRPGEERDQHLLCTVSGSPGYAALRHQWLECRKGREGQRIDLGTKERTQAEVL